MDPSSGIRLSMNFAPLKKLQKESPKFFHKAMKKGAIQFLTWCNTGSAKESRKPPIRYGVLRGSSSAFVGKELVAVYPQPISPGSKEGISPAKTYAGRELVITWGWNTAYAKKMHETKYKPGKFTAQDKDAGNKWLEKHLKRDKDALMEMIAIEFKKEAGT